MTTRRINTSVPSQTCLISQTWGPTPTHREELKLEYAAHKTKLSAPSDHSTTVVNGNQATAPN